MRRFSIAKFSSKFQALGPQKSHRENPQPNKFDTLSALHHSSIARNEETLQNPEPKTPELCKTTDLQETMSRKPAFETYSLRVKQCTAKRSLLDAQRLHNQMTEDGFQGHIHLGKNMIEMYIKCSGLEHACQLFDKMPHRPTISWNLIISGHIREGLNEKALGFFSKMVSQNTNKPDQFTFTSAFKACSAVGGISQGKQLHALFIKYGIGLDGFLSSAIVDMYCNCCCLDDAKMVFLTTPIEFHDVISWTSLIVGMSRNNKKEDALELLGKMHGSGISPNQITVSSGLSICAELGAVEKGRQIHCYVVKCGFHEEKSIQSGFVSMYSKFGNLEDMERYFAEICEPCELVWTSLIAGYEKNGYGEEALRLLIKMLNVGFKPIEFTWASVVGACAGLALLHQGMQLHSLILQSGYESSIFVKSSLVDLYMKCGNMSDAQALFHELPIKDVVCWNSMIVGCAQNGLWSDVLVFFEEMQKCGVRPNGLTFLSILSACSHMGMLDLGVKFFNYMTKDYDILPTEGHYGCMVGIFCGAGLLSDAVALIHGMPFQPSLVIWRTLLSSCRRFGSFKVAECVAAFVLKSDPEDHSTFVQLSNIYTEVGMLSEVARVWSFLKKRRIKKEPGQSWIQVSGKVHSFFVEDRLHPDSDKIYDLLENLRVKMKREGYIPNTKCSFPEI